MLTSGVNIINVLSTAFTCADPESIRTQSSCQYHYTLLGSVCVKAVQKMFMKLTPGFFTDRLIIIFQKK